MKAPRIGFRARLLIGAILPALLMVSALATAFLDRYGADIERSFLERGKAIARQLGVAAEYAMFTGSYGSLDMLAAGVRQSDGDIVSISVLGLDGRRLAGSGPLPRHALLLKDELQVLSDARQVAIQASIRKAVLPLEGEIWDAGPAMDKAGANGYVLVEISRQRIEARKDEMLRITLAIVLGGLLLASWISASIAGDVLRRLETARRELARQKEAAEALARTDALTGLANRRAFDEAAEREMRRARRYGSALALIITDIDHFKAINDAHGHACGDQVLVDFARTLLVSVRDVDLVGRWGGEEFVVLMPGTDLDEALRAAERMRLAVAGVPTRFEGRVCGYTASFGVAAFRPEDAGLDALLGRADAALYRAKETGRNRVEVG